jgi:hypothetical protein
MQTVNLPPNAGNLLDSMRAVGYTLESAVADLVDNSISARATRVDILFSPANNPYFIIRDNGIGMSQAELQAAMRHGSQSPHNKREATDLGRFGLGLKTASISQCQKLTVISKTSSSVAVACWDLEYLRHTNDWLLQIPDTHSICNRLGVSLDELIPYPTGTVVIWENLDLFATGWSTLFEAFTYKIEPLRNHLSLVFHRYLSGEAGSLQVFFNGTAIKFIDPFLLNYKYTQKLQSDEYVIEGSIVKVQPYILPHISYIEKVDLDQLAGETGIRRNQGFYLYRNKRLISYGTWFNLIRQDESSKLARVQVDFTNELDSLWLLDVKKSQVIPPKAIRQNLNTTIKRIEATSKSVIIKRSYKNPSNSIHTIWERNEGRNGIYYSINRNHAAIKYLLDKFGSQSEHVKSLLTLIESNIPIDSIYGDLANDEKVKTHNDTEPQIRVQFLAMLDQLCSTGFNRETTKTMLLEIEPYKTYHAQLSKEN